VDLDKMKAEVRDEVAEAKADALGVWGSITAFATKWKWPLIAVAGLAMVLMVAVASAGTPLLPMQDEEPKAPTMAISPNGEAQVYLLDAPCTEPNVLKMLINEIGAVKAKEMAMNLRQAVYVERGRVAFQGCYRYLRLGAHDGPVVGAGMIWGDGSGAQLPLTEFQEIPASELPKVVRERDGTA